MATIFEWNYTDLTGVTKVETLGTVTVADSGGLNAIKTNHTGAAGWSSLGWVLTDAIESGDTVTAYIQFMIDTDTGGDHQFMYVGSTSADIAYTGHSSAYKDSTAKFSGFSVAAPTWIPGAGLVAGTWYDLKFVVETDVGQWYGRVSTQTPTDFDPTSGNSWEQIGTPTTGSGGDYSSGDLHIALNHYGNTSKIEWTRMIITTDDGTLTPGFVPFVRNTAKVMVRTGSL